MKDTLKTAQTVYSVLCPYEQINSFTLTVQCEQWVWNWGWKALDGGCGVEERGAEH